MAKLDISLNIVLKIVEILMEVTALVTSECLFSLSESPGTDTKDSDLVMILVVVKKVIILVTSLTSAKSVVELAASKDHIARELENRVKYSLIILVVAKKDILPVNVQIAPVGSKCLVALSAVA